MMQKFSAEFRFYEELNDFLPRHRKKQSFTYPFNGKPTVKDAIEACGVPHPEVDVVLVNGVSVAFDYHLRDGDRVAVYPEFESWDITPLLRLREKPLRDTRFVLDIHLGKLARFLRLCGFDCCWDKALADHRIVEIAVLEKRIILTRDQALLKHGRVERGYWVRHTSPTKQLAEVLDRFDLHRQVQPFGRCMLCNGLLRPVKKSDILARLPAKTRLYYSDFQQCTDCQKVYWPGSHYQRMNQMLEKIIPSK